MSLVFMCFYLRESAKYSFIWLGRPEMTWPRGSVPESPPQKNRKHMCERGREGWVLRPLESSAAFHSGISCALPFDRWDPADIRRHVTGQGPPSSPPLIRCSGRPNARCRLIVYTILLQYLISKCLAIAPGKRFWLLHKKGVLCAEDTRRWQYNIQRCVAVCSIEGFHLTLAKCISFVFGTRFSDLKICPLPRNLAPSTFNSTQTSPKLHRSILLTLLLSWFVSPKYIIKIVPINALLILHHSF